MKIYLLSQEHLGAATCACSQSAECNTPIKNGIWSCVFLWSNITKTCSLQTFSMIFSAELFWLWKLWLIQQPEPDLQWSSQTKLSCVQRRESENKQKKQKPNTMKRNLDKKTLSIKTKQNKKTPWRWWQLQPQDLLVNSWKTRESVFLTVTKGNS